MTAHQLQWSTATVRDDLIELSFVGSETRSSLLLIGRIHGRIREKGGWRGVTRRPRVAVFRDPSQRLPAAFRAQIAQRR